MKKDNKSVIDYRLFEMLKGNPKYKLSFKQLNAIRKKDIIETIFEYLSSFEKIQSEKRK